MSTSPIVRPSAAVARRLVLLAVSAIVLAGLIYVGRWLTFWYDEWSVILDRSTPSVDTLLAPHVDHLSIVPVAIYQAMLATVGLESYWPYLALLWACHFATCGLLYLVIRRPAGPLIATVACISLLTLGAAFEDVLHVFQVSFLISTVFGLLAIERLSRRSVGRAHVAVAMIALAIAVGSSSVGVLFTGLVIAWAIFDRRRDLLIAAAPVAALYGLWYLTWGRSGAGAVGEPLSAPGSTIATFGFGLGAAVVALTGLPPYLYAPLGWIIGVAAGVRALMLGHRPGALGLAALAALVAEYALQAWFRSGFGIEYAARSGYLYPAAIFLWIAIGDTLRGVRDVRIGRTVGVVLVLALALAFAGNAVQFLGAGRAMRILRVDEVAELRLIEALRAEPGLDRGITPDPELIPQVTAERYLRSADRFGTPSLWIEQSRPTVVSDEATPARVTGAALRLLHDAFDVGRETVVVDGSAVEVDAPGSLATAPDGCLRASGSAPFHARWAVRPGTGVRLAAHDGAAPSFGLGLAPGGVVPPEADVQAAFEAGKAVIPPKLPAGMGWFADLGLPAGSTEFCLVAPAPAP